MDGRLKKSVTLALATGFGLGLAPIASGTFGSLPGVLIAAAMSGLHPALQACAAAVLAAAAVPVCGAAEKVFGKKDDGRIVADEYLTFSICLIGIPWTVAPWFLAPAFVVCRIMDIVKIPPARQSQRIPGGLGIVLDDVLSSLYALAINHLLWRALTA